MAGPTRIYTLADSGYFVGLAALLNSLRLTGNTHELVVLDCGLGETQRRLLAGHVTLVRLPEAVVSRKLLAKAYLSRLVSPDELVLYLDSDVLVTRSLEPMLATAAAGRICVAPVDWPEKRGRSIAGWQQLFGLTEPIRQEIYVNAGFVALAATPWRSFLERWWELCCSIPDEAVFRGEIDDNPIWAGDQDALNALLMSEVPRDAVVRLPETAAVFPPELERVEVRDVDRLGCTLDGQPVTMLHYSWVPKPWEPRSWRRMNRPLQDAYALLLPRVLFADDVLLRLRRDEVPAWLRGGTLGAAARRGTAAARAARRLGARAVTHLPAPARERLIAARDRLEPKERG